MIKANCIFDYDLNHINRVTEYLLQGQKRPVSLCIQISSLFFYTQWHDLAVYPYFHPIYCRHSLQWGDHTYNGVPDDFVNEGINRDQSIIQINGNLISFNRNIQALYLSRPLQRL